jgi:Glycolipid 2-alpha-mannosyltransferase
LSNSRGFPVLALFVLAFAAISLYVLVVRPFGRKPEHDPSKAAKEYNEYLASPVHQALIYPAEDDPKRANAAIIALVRNSELTQMMQSMRELEETFNRKFKYPWIFFNDEPFDDKFKRMTSSLTDAETHYGTKLQIMLMDRGHSERALGRSDLDSSGYDAGIIQ